ncbi:hypothetical protein A9P82_10575 [Arachidicoccus ginsenosidimutans]|uniref:site-specific integrase n=1 Tax=Arachidicoccus sp. BS20 TaxID=1850526 RepID=UPI0007F17C39|nr:site-specific integrase [Arachidicoccus sp. BS20]ANI89694.1 hypothetical protein A9P82_10575 [Arachidicoccus sp. BS20]
MNLNQTFSILVWQYKMRSQNGKAPLFVRITVNGKRAQIAVGRNAPVALWDKNAQKVKGNSVEAMDINKHLDSLKSSLHRHHSRLVTMGKIVTAQMLKNEFYGLSEERKTLENAIDAFEKLYEEKVENGMVSNVTLKIYKNTCSKMRDFILKKYKANGLFLNEITPFFMDEFEHFLRIDCKLSNNSSMKRIALAKSIFIMAHRRGWMKANLASEYKCRYEDKEPTRLEMEELQVLCKKEIANRRLSETRDCYVFMCFTGYAYIDVSGLTHSNIFIGPDGNKWVTKHRQKTDNAECVPLFPIPLQIIERYKNHPKCKDSGKLLPINSNQKFNAYLKELSSICSINKELTTHTARHTFATTVTLENGVPIETVSKMLGHHALKSTQRYARVTRKKISENMAELKERLFKDKFRYTADNEIL